jgi:hypothetical protein
MLKAQEFSEALEIQKRKNALCILVRELSFTYSE